LKKGKYCLVSGLASAVIIEILFEVKPG